MKADRISIGDIRIFLSAATYKNYTKAAKSLYTTQPTITKVIHHMEKELGVILFEKEGKGMHLTTQGLYLYEQYQPLLSELDHIYDALHTKNTTIKIGILEGYDFENLLFEHLTTINKKHPELTLSINIYDLHELIEYSDDLDIVFMNTLEASSLNHYHFMEIDKIPYYLVVSRNHPLAKKNSVHLKDLAQEHHFILCQKETLSTLEFVKQTWDIVNLHPTFETVDNRLTLLMKISQNSGVSLLPAYMIKGYEDKLTLIPLADFPSTIYRIMGINDLHSFSDRLVFLEDMRALLHI